MTFPAEIQWAGQIYVQKTGGPVQAYRVPHDIERVMMNADRADYRYRGNLPGFANALRGGTPRGSVVNTGEPLPEVYRLDPEHSTVLGCNAQNMWWGLDPGITAKKQSTLLDNNFALSNQTGFPGSHNCLTGEEAKKPFPRFDQPRVWGGQILFGVEDGEILRISSMLVSRGILPAAEVLKHIEWWAWMLSVTPRGTNNIITRPGFDGVTRVPVRAPLLTTLPVTLPLVELHKLPPGFLPPSPLWMP